MSVITVSDSVGQIMTNIMLTAIISFASWGIWQLINKINNVDEFVTGHKETHIALSKDVARIEKESKEQYEDLKEQIGDMRHTFETKLDNLAKEFRKGNS